MKKNRFIPILACSVLLLASAACSSAKNADVADPSEPVTIIAHQDSPIYDSIDGLSDKADTIVKGQVIGSQVVGLDDRIATDSQDEELNPGGDEAPVTKIYTVYTVRVEETYKGDAAPGDTIQVKQLGGQIGNTTLVTEEKVNIAGDNEYIFFLATYPDSPATLLNPIQSLYVYEPTAGSGGASPNSSAKGIAPSQIVSANPNNTLTLRPEDLAQIKSEFAPK